MKTRIAMQHVGVRPAVLLALATLAAGGTAFADDNAWQGGTGFWNDPGSWSDGLPTSASDVLIDGGDAGTASDVTLNITASISTLTIDAGDQLTQLNAFDLTLNNDGTRNDGIWIMDGTGSDTFLQFRGDQVLNGTGELIVGDNLVNRIITDGTTLTNGVGHTIRGGGRLLANTGGMINEGSVIAEGTMQIDANGLGFTNNAVVQVADGGRLELLAGLFTNNTSIDVANNGVLSLESSAEVVGGVINTTGSGVVELGGLATLVGVTSNAAVDQLNAVDVNFEGGLTNNGTWAMNGTGSDTFAQFFGAQTLDGSGEWVINNNAVNRIITNNTVLTHGANHTIRGGGRLLANTGGLINNGTIIAEGAMEIDPNGLGFVNDGTIEVTSGSSLGLIAGVFFNNTSIDVASGGTLNITSSAEVIGGELNTSGTGSVALLGLGTLDGVTANALINQLNAVDLNVRNGLTNNGTWMMDGVGSDTFAQFIGDQSLDGTGELVIADNSVNRVITNNTVLTHGADHTIRGGGRLLANTGGMINNGTIIAEGAMEIDPNSLGFTNNATLQVSSGSSLGLIAGVFTNNSAIDVADNSVLNLTSGAEVVGGVINTTGSGIVDILALATLDGVTVNGDMNQGNSRDLNIEGGLTNNGTWTMGGQTSDTFAQFIGDQTLGGTGTLVLAQSTVNRVITNNTVLTNGADHTIRGGGRLLANTGGLINEGTIIADSDLVDVEIDANSNGFVNAASGTLIAANAAGIDILSGGFENSGAIEIAAGSRLSRSGGDYLQFGGRTTVNGLLDVVSGSDFVDLQGGLVEGNGTIDSDVVNTGGVLSAGDALTTGTLTIEGDYSQESAGELSVQLGGLGQGTDFDWVSISGDGTLDGALSVSLVDGFAAQLGDTFDILSAVIVTGAFDVNQLFFPVFNGRTFDIEYLADTVRLTTVEAAVIPVPAAFWLLGTSLIGLAGMRRRRVAR